MEQAPLVAGQIVIQPLAGIPRQDQVQGIPEDFLQVQVQRPRRPVEIDIGVEVQAGIQKTAER